MGTLVSLMCAFKLFEVIYNILLMHKPNKADKYEKLDKLGEGTYGVVYKAQGNSALIKTRKQVKYLPSKRFVWNLKKKVFHPLPSAKYPSSKNWHIPTSSPSAKSSTPIANSFWYSSILIMISRSSWATLAKKREWIP